MILTDAGFGTTGGFGTSAFGTTANTGGLFGSAQNKPGLFTILAGIMTHLSVTENSECILNK